MMNNYQNRYSQTPNQYKQAPAYTPANAVYVTRSAGQPMLGTYIGADENPFDPEEERPHEQPQLPSKRATASAALSESVAPYMHPQGGHLATERSEALGESDDTLAWNDVIRDNSTAHVLLDEGDYTFTVTAVEQGRFPGSQKSRPCGKAMVTLVVDTPDGPAYARRDFFLREKLSWQLSAFFRCLGMMKRGEEFRMDWDGSIGRTGRAHFRPEQYTNAYGETRDKNTVTAFYDAADKRH